MTDVVVVESPAKAKTINKYLGDGYTVLASFGHVRDLPAKDGSVRPEEDFAMDWSSEERGEKQVREIVQALKSGHSKRLYLATDPDREGEAISWHVRQMLEGRKALKGIEVHRITFNEITKRAIQHAIEHPRDLDIPLIDAYLARRALDYLVGFTLSPVLWRKLPGSRSAGRVQSVALRLITDRESEIEVFKPREYWSIEAAFRTPTGAPFTARLTHLDGKRLDQFDLSDEAAATRAKQTVEAGTFTVSAVEKKRTRRNPPPPFTTSTLQQESSRKLGFGAQATMRLAQQLYEGVDIGGETVGLITYMRTDGVQMSREAIGEIRTHVQSAFGDPYLPSAPREYATKAKNAQEAHEAIRPTDVTRTPQDVARYLNPEQRRLYDLVWKRAVASQMQSAEMDQTAVDIDDKAGRARLRATGQVIAFDGYLKLYREDIDDPKQAADDENRTLPPIAQGEEPRRDTVTAAQHFTQPPPRYSEASLVKKMEELGIGRPSTYASILQTLQDREYVRIDARRFIPEDRGRLVTAFLVSFFERYVDSNFTAALEEKLDDISGGRADWRAVMHEFWDQFRQAVDATKDLKISDVIDALDEDLGPHFFPAREGGTDPRACPTCVNEHRANGRLGLRLGRTGAFIGCSNYPECRYTRPLVVPSADGEDSGNEGPRNIGTDPGTGQEISLRRGPYGLYVQLGEPGTDAKGKPTKPRRASLPRGMDPETLTLDRAVTLLNMPRVVGLHPETGEEITANLGRFGPYLKMGALSQSVQADDDILSLGMNRAMELLANAKPRGYLLGNHPKDGTPVEVKRGRFGPYAQHGTTVASLPRGVEMESFTLDQAVALLAEKGKPLPPKKGPGGRKAPPKKAAPKAKEAAEATAPPAPAAKPAAKKAAAKKPAAKKAAPNKAAKPPAARKAAAKGTA